MSLKRPAVVDNGDTLVVIAASGEDYRVPFTFVQALNEGVLFDRTIQDFRDAAHDHHLFEIINTRTEALVGTCILQETPSTDGHMYEVGGMMIHPGARHIGLNTLLTRAVMVREFCLCPQTFDQREYVAHVVAGYSAPLGSIIESGFRAGGQVLVKPRTVQASLEHMLEPSGEGVVMQSYIFNPAKIKSLIVDLHAFMLRDNATLRSKQLAIRVDLSGMLNPAELERYIAELPDRS